VDGQPGGSVRAEMKHTALLALVGPHGAGKFNAPDGAAFAEGTFRIMTLPGDAGHVAIAVFVKASEAPAAKRERAIAEIARAAHDYFLLQ